MRLPVLLILWAIAMVCSLIVLCVLSLTATASQADGNVRFAVLVDAGSSGSRVHVFKYRPAKDSQHYPEVLLPSMEKKVTPGLSFYAPTGTGAGESLVPLLRFAKQQVPEELWQSTPLYLFATAGMRMLPPAQAQAVMESARHTLAASGLRFMPSWARILPGNKEGLYAWVGYNYAAGMLQALAAQADGAGKDVSGPASPGEGMEGSEGHQETARVFPPPLGGTWGVLELGGASMQITYLPRAPAALDDEYTSHLPLPGLAKRATLYTHSFLGFGADMAFHNASTLTDASGTNPCLPKGYKHTAGVPGNGNFSACTRLLAGLLPKVECLHAQCSIGGEYLPPLSGMFLATENFYYTAMRLGMRHGVNSSDTALAQGPTGSSVRHRHSPPPAPLPPQGGKGGGDRDSGGDADGELGGQRWRPAGSNSTGMRAVQVTAAQARAKQGPWRHHRGAAGGDGTDGRPAGAHGGAAGPHQAAAAAPERLGKRGGGASGGMRLVAGEGKQGGKVKMPRPKARVQAPFLPGAAGRPWEGRQAGQPAREWKGVLRALRGTGGKAPHEVVHVASVGELAHAGEQFCARPWSELEVDLVTSKGMPKEYVIKTCFSAAYAYVLLHDGFHFTEVDKQLVFSNTVQALPDGAPREVNWVLGALLVQVVNGHVNGGRGGGGGSYRVPDELADRLQDKSSRLLVLMALLGAGICIAMLLGAAWMLGVCGGKRAGDGAGSEADVEEQAGLVATAAAPDQPVGKQQGKASSGGEGGGWTASVRAWWSGGYTTVSAQQDSTAGSGNHGSARIGNKATQLVRL